MTVAGDAPRDGTGEAPAAVGGIPGQAGDPRRRAFHAVGAAQVATYWWSDVERGLDPAEAAKRLARLGPNALGAPRARRAGLAVGLATVESGAVGLAVAAGLAGAVGAGLDAVMLAAAALAAGVAAYAGMGRRGSAPLAAAGTRARVVRGGAAADLAASQLVPGDLVSLEAGDAVPADLRLVASEDLAVDEGELTGDTTPAAKDATVILAPGAPLDAHQNLVHLGGHVTRGRARGLVCNTGLHTELGVLARLRARALPASRADLWMARLGRAAAMAGGIVALGAAGAGHAAGLAVDDALRLGAAALAACAPLGLAALGLRLAARTQKAPLRAALGTAPVIFLRVRDPNGPRGDLSAALAATRAAGRRVVLVTDAHPVAARALADALGLLGDDGEVLAGSAIAAADDKELRALATGTVVVGGATPAQELRLAGVLAARGEPCALVGPAQLATLPDELSAGRGQATRRRRLCLGILVAHAGLAVWVVAGSIPAGSVVVAPALVVGASAALALAALALA